MDYSKRTDEISRLHQHFDTMAGRIQYLVQEQLCESDFQAATQSLRRWNPKLTRIFIQYPGNHKLAGQGIKGPADFLHGGIPWNPASCHPQQQKPLVSLDYEIGLAGSYMTIQKIRFEDRLLFHVECLKNWAKHLSFPSLSSPFGKCHTLRHGGNDGYL